jgi:hypothetical protein
MRPSAQPTFRHCLIGSALARRGYKPGCAYLTARKRDIPIPSSKAMR